MRRNQPSPLRERAQQEANERFVEMQRQLDLVRIKVSQALEYHQMAAILVEHYEKLLDGLTLEELSAAHESALRVRLKTGLDAARARDRGGREHVIRTIEAVMKDVPNDPSAPRLIVTPATVTVAPVAYDPLLRT